MSLPHHLTILVILLVTASCGRSDAIAGPGAGDKDHGIEGSAGGVLRLAVTTSTRDSGLLDVLIPPFEKRRGIHVDVIAMGTGAALQQGRDGNVDALLVHSLAAEQEFMQAGHGVRRIDVMSNSFELLGPPDDPAGIAGLEPALALAKIRERKQRFISRGDESGTHLRELRLWGSAKQHPTWAAYTESGQGMGASLTMADQMGAYILCDRGTYLKRKGDIRLRPLTAPSAAMDNPYGALAVNPNKHKFIQGELADEFLNYLMLPSTQDAIQHYKIGGESLFRPAHLTE